MATLLKCFKLKSYPLKSAMPFRRSLATTPKMFSQHWQQEGIPGSNMPFSSSNKTVFTIVYIALFGAGMAAPFVLLRRHLLILSTPSTVVKNQELTKIVCMKENVEN
ncbi:cytochrome c oxidase subunit 7C mitochondrial [Biomphalaria pfeifferi]|uniref:Cytochrome c oxidase subunit 7C mitochondrial n=1 Tax=Biomphalaria pfeifferi TaxID=112525 RepID=A0AAD8B049_BIOPF|nr:cytochrome c oxidase subunit 7C mitochondrial [Biomphalaria pfeifferi]